MREPWSALASEAKAMTCCHATCVSTEVCRTTHEKRKGESYEHCRRKAARASSQPEYAVAQMGTLFERAPVGTVREDYSSTGDAWDYFSHEQARSRAYHWGEDGLSGITDDGEHLCFAVALWNGKDPILKERLFGLTNSEGNHGEDAKEYYFYIDSTPTHSYMKYLYKYPQAAYPYEALVSTNRQRNRHDFEYELLDTGVFNENRYFDVFVEYAKETPEDLLIRITVANRGPEAASLHILPTLWFRNTWSWSEGVAKPSLMLADGVVKEGNVVAVEASDRELGKRFLYCEGTPALLFTENETNNERIFHTPNQSPYVKDGINDRIVNGRTDAVNPAKKGTKAAAHYEVSVGAGASEVIRLRLTNVAPDAQKDAYGAAKGNLFGKHFDEVFQTRLREADEFYVPSLQNVSVRTKLCVMRQGLAGMLWSKQYFIFDVEKWLVEHDADPLRR